MKDSCRVCKDAMSIRLFIISVKSPSRTLKMLTFVHSFFSSCGGLRFFRMDSPRISMR